MLPVSFVLYALRVYKSSNIITEKFALEGVVYDGAG